MIVDHLCTSLEGGAATAARRLHHALLDAGIESRFWYEKPKCAPPDRSYRRLEWPGRGAPTMVRPWIRLAARGRRAVAKRRLRRAIGRHPAGRDPFSLAEQGYPTPWDRAQLRTDIVHLHWVADFIDYRSFFDSLPDELPIVWTLHDLNPFTGGCHYTGGCDNFTHQCGNCPQLARPGPTDLSYHTHAIKREVLHGRNLRLVAPGEWMREQCRRSSLFGQLENIHTIHNGLDTAVFAPRDRAEARRELGLPESKVVVAFGAESLRDRRKGVSELLTSLELLARPEEILAVAFGRGELRHRRRPLPEIRCTGYIDEPTRLAALYSSADLFVIPSLQENCPQTALEAMACGTPVVGFAAGGIPDYVSPYQTGLLARPGDPRDLAAKISWMIDHPEERTQMGREARTLTTREYSLETQAGRISDLYSSLIKEQTGGPGRDASN